MLGSQRRGRMIRDAHRMVVKSLLLVAMFALLTPVALALHESRFKAATLPANPDYSPIGTQAGPAGPDPEGPSISNVRATPPLARPFETVSIGAVITDPSGIPSAWVRIEGPGVNLNVTLVAFGDMWFLNRSWESVGGYAFEIGAVDGDGNINTAAGSFQVQDSLANTFGLVVLLGTLLAVGSGAIIVLWFRRRPTREA